MDQRREFDELFKLYFSDSGGTIRSAFDLLVEEGQLDETAMAMVYANQYGIVHEKDDGDTSLDELTEEICALAMAVQRLDFRIGAIQRKDLNWDARVTALMDGFVEYVFQVLLKPIMLPRFLYIINATV